MTTSKAKIAISIDADALQEVRAAVAQGAAPNVSAYLERAAVAQLGAEAEFDRVLDAIFEQTGGPLTGQEITAADRLLTGHRR